MKQSNRTITGEGKKIDTLPDELRKHYEDSMRHNQELMKQLAHL